MALWLPLASSAWLWHLIQIAAKLIPLLADQDLSKGNHKSSLHQQNTQLLRQQSSDSLESGLFEEYQWQVVELSALTGTK